MTASGTGLSYVEILAKPRLGPELFKGSEIRSRFDYWSKLDVLMDDAPTRTCSPKLSDFWDGAAPGYSDPIEVHLEFADFTTDLGLLALLTDFRTAGDPTIARLSYVFRKKADITRIPQSSDDCEFVVFGGGDEARPVPSKVRRRIAIDVLDALRDAEGQLGTWRSSPLRPLLEDAISGVARADLDAVAAELDKATKTLEVPPTVKALEDELRAGILHLSGKAHDIDARLRFAPSDANYLKRPSMMVS